MKTYRIAVVAGDGIGPEVIAATRELLLAVAGQVGGFRLEFLDAPAGTQVYLDTGEDLPAATLETCRNADAILLGACGLPDVRRPDGTELTPQITLRRELDLFAGHRPVRTFRGVIGALAGNPTIDLLIVRENTEGLFASMGAGDVQDNETARDTQVITRRGTVRIVRAAFNLARGRPHPKRRVTCVDKANVLRSFAFFRQVFDEVAAEYPDVRSDHLYVDAAALQLVRRPRSLDVLVTENLLGDILSDLAAGLIGGLGMAPSADVGERYAVFQPCHGSAPDIAGQGIANPVAAMLSGGMLLAHLSRLNKDDAVMSAAWRVERTIEAVLANGLVRTPDIGGRASTSEFTSAVIDGLGRG